MSSRHPTVDNDFGGILNVEPGTPTFKFTYQFLNRYLKSNDNALQMRNQPKNLSSSWKARI